MNYVVDASVAIKWYIPEAYEQEADRLLKGRHVLHVPELIYPEIGNIIWKKTARQELTTDEANEIVAAIRRERWTVHPHKNVFKSAVTGALGTGQSVYDWTYLALAISLSIEFVTADEKFYRALETTGLQASLKWIGDL